MSTPAGRHGHPLPTLLLFTLTPISLALIAQPLLPVILPYSFLTNLDAYLPPTPAFPALQACVGFSLLAFVGAVSVVPAVSEAFVKKGLSGRDLLKPGGRVSGPVIPECLGLPIACLYILLMMLFIPFPFSHMFSGRAPGADKAGSIGRECFPTSELTLYLSSLLSLLVATLLGFIDDLFDIRWRHKLPIPLIAAIPTLVVYYSEGGLTSVVLPKGIGRWIESLGWGGWVGSKVIDLGPVYYLYLLLLPTFTTNSINILAGVNGVECIQALIIASSVLLNDLLFLPIWPKALLLALGVGEPETGRFLAFAGGEMVQRHLMSAYFMGPLVGVSAGFLWHNWYPARAFPGDTFCYFTGMAFSAVALQGHFSKTLILFFIPQIFNFILSCPQLFHLVDCPRHRLPAYDVKTDLLHPSRVEFLRPPPAHTRMVLRILEMLGLVRLERLDGPRKVLPAQAQAQGPCGQIISSTNLTILNFLLVRLGPMREDTLCFIMGAVQVGCSALAFGIRYGLGAWVYGGDRR